MTRLTTVVALDLPLPAPLHFFLLRRWFRPRVARPVVRRRRIARRVMRRL